MEVLCCDQQSVPDLAQRRLGGPLISIVVTHYNYSDFVKDALESLVNQTYKNWECVVVDDASQPRHRTNLETIISGFADERIRLHCHSTNMGQVPSFFTGVSKTTGDFVCLLDPDDRYASTFLEDALTTHLDAGILCPLVSTDQILATKRGVIGSGLRANFRIATARSVGNYFELEPSQQPRVFYIPAKVPGWHWTSTTALMFRRAALNYLRPHKPLAYKGCADGYLAQGAHVLGGTLFLQKPLVFRTLHEKNSWISDEIFSSFQDKQRPGANQWAAHAYKDALDAISANGAPCVVPKAIEHKTLEFRQTNPRHHMRRWKRSIMKRIA